MTKQTINKALAVFFPKDSEAMFDKKSDRTFGGSTIHLYQFVKELYDFTNVYSLIPEYNNIDFDDGEQFNIIKLYKENDNALIKFIKFRKFIIQHNVDTVMQLGLTIQSCIMALYCHLSGIKFVFLFAHDVESIGLYQNSRKKCIFFPILIKYSSILITQNDIEKDNLVSQYPGLSKIRVLKKGIDFTRIKRSDEKLYDAISIARCEEWKNIEAYLEIVKLNINYRFILIAPPVPGKEDYHEKIKTQTAQLTNLTFYSFVPYDDVYKFLSESKVIFVTSDMEGDWPLTVIEAAATGLPVISLNYSYGSLVDGYGAGFYCAGNTKKMNEYFMQLMTDQTLLQSMSENALTYANDNHNSKNNVQHIVNWLELKK